jgi:peptide/nickel transport system ATP-binding protein
VSDLQSAGRSDEATLLEVTDLRTHFRTDRGLVRAVDGVTFSIERGSALGIVGESGSGKTVLARAIMGLLPKRGTVQSGSVRFAGQEILGLSARQMRHLWGREMSMIFQDPMSSLNPLMKVGRQITEPL